MTSRKRVYQENLMLSKLNEMNHAVWSLNDSAPIIYRIFSHEAGRYALRKLTDHSNETVIEGYFEELMPYMQGVINGIRLTKALTK